MQFSVIGHYNIGNPQDITDQMTWFSFDTKVATVDAKGVATATGSGRVIIKTQIFEPATQQTLQANTTLTVVPQLTEITISPATCPDSKSNFPAIHRERQLQRRHECGHHCAGRVGLLFIRRHQFQLVARHAGSVR